MRKFYKKLHERIRHTKLSDVTPAAWVFAVSLVLISALFGYAYVRIFTLTGEVQQLTAKLASTTVTFSAQADSFSASISDLDQRALGLSDTLQVTQQSIENTKKSVATVQSQVGGVEQVVGEISGTVGTLEKLSKIDPELLQKYSKVYFLNEHYAPERVIEITPKHLYVERNPELIHALVLPHLENLLAAAENAGVTVFVSSAYRSFDEQRALKGNYTITYGVGSANQFSADQGYSEHQLGTTVDFITTGLGGQLSGFEKTDAYRWLLDNAHLYGFTLSYPEDNGFYIFEPWHWRFVGKTFASDLHATSKHFYDMDQRAIDEYLVSFLD